MHRIRQLVVFALDEQRFAIPLQAIERVVRAVEITPLPDAPEFVLGVINVQGRVVPVFDVRGRFRLPARELDLNDQFIIAQSSRRMVALVVDAVLGVVECAEADVTTAEQILPGLHCVAGVLKREDGMILIHDRDEFLSHQAQAALEDAMTDQSAP